MGPRPRGPVVTGGWGEVPSEDSVALVAPEPATRASLLWTHTGSPIPWSSTSGETRQGEMDALTQGSDGEWVFRLTEEDGEEPESSGVPVGRPDPREGQVESGLVEVGSGGVLPSDGA